MDQNESLKTLFEKARQAFQDFTKRKKEIDKEIEKIESELKEGEIKEKIEKY